MVFLLIAGTIAGAGLLVFAVRKDPGISTEFNFPRFKNQAELQGPPGLPGNISYTCLAASGKGRDRDINWPDVIRKGPYDVVIISDSFLQCPGGMYLCREIAARNNFRVLHIVVNNFEFSDANQFRMLLYFTRNGFLRDTGARYVILGNAERTLGHVLKPDLNESSPMPEYVPEAAPERAKNAPGDRTGILSALRAINSSLTLPGRYCEDAGSMVTTIKTWALNVLLSFTGDSVVDKSLYFARLSETRFTDPVYGSRLIYYKDDVAFRRFAYPEAPMTINSRLNRVSGELHEQNITLIFIPGVSTYNTHYRYIVSPPTARDPYFEILRVLNKTYIYVDTKEIADEKLAEGLSDLHGTGDPSHWTWVLTEDIADRLDFPAMGRNLTFPLVYDENTEYEKALGAFRAVIHERDCTDTWALNNDGRSYLKSGDTSRAAGLFRKSLGIDPDQPDIRKMYESARTGT